MKAVERYKFVFVDRGLPTNYAPKDDLYMHYPNEGVLNRADEMARGIRRRRRPDMKRDIANGTYGPQPQIKAQKALTPN
jgi:hypothetical protein